MLATSKLMSAVQTWNCTASILDFINSTLLFFLVPWSIVVIIIIMFISSNYLSVSGEHRVHFNTNVCSRFCCTTHPFSGFRVPIAVPYMGGSVFILVIRRGVCANAAVYFKAISPMTQPHRFLVSHHIHDTTYSFRISPCPLCSLLLISGLWHSTEIDSLFIVAFPQASSTSANNL